MISEWVVARVVVDFEKEKRLFFLKNEQLPKQLPSQKYGFSIGFCEFSLFNLLSGDVTRAKPGSRGRLAARGVGFPWCLPAWSAVPGPWPLVPGPWPAKSRREASFSHFERCARL